MTSTQKVTVLSGTMTISNSSGTNTLTAGTITVADASGHNIQITFTGASVTVTATSLQNKNIQW